MMCAQSQRLKIHDLIALTRPRDRKPQVLAMLEAYFDESGIHDGAAICVIAGYFGYAAHWKAQEIKWRNVLDSYHFPLKDFHARAMVGSRQYQPMLEELALSLSKSSIYPVFAGIIVDDFNSFSEKQRRFMTGAPLDEKSGKLKASGSPNKPYFVPFQFALKSVTDHTQTGRKASFFFGLATPMAGYANEIFKQIKTQQSWPESAWKSKRRLGDPAFPLAKETPQLQAADLLAYLTYLYMQERHAANDWTVAPDGLLATCLQNRRSPDDLICHRKESLQSRLDATYEIAGNWDGH
jgi:hypothetical protein